MWCFTQDYRYIGISGFLFLRFLAPAILSPKLFSLQEQHPNAKTSRSLTLLAKVIQTIGNLSLTSGVTYKEPWLEFLRPIIQESIPEVKIFIDDIVSIDDDSAGGLYVFSLDCNSIIINRNFVF